MHSETKRSEWWKNRKLWLVGGVPLAFIIAIALLVAPSFAEWLQSIITRTQDDDGSRGLFGNSSQLASALISLGTLIAALYAAAHTRMIYRDQRRSADERLLLDLATKFWSKEFYERRQNSHELWHYMRKGDVDRVAEECSDSDRVMQAAVAWTVVGDFPMRLKLVQSIVSHHEFAENHPETSAEERAKHALDLIRSHFEVLNFWTLYDTVLERSDDHEVALVDFLWPQWHWTGAMVSKFSTAVQSYGASQQRQGVVAAPLAGWHSVLHRYQNRKNVIRETLLSISIPEGPQTEVKFARDP